MTNNQAFIDKLESIVSEHYTDEQFGVSELVESYGMSRSQLHRKLKAANGKSISQFIREFRLEEAYKLLRDEDYTASEIAFKVGFNSASYFNTCFNDYFGYPPGEVRHMEIEERPTGHDIGETTASRFRNRTLIIYLIVIVLVITAFFIYRLMGI